MGHRVYIGLYIYIYIRVPHVNDFKFVPRGFGYTGKLPHLLVGLWEF